MVDLRKDPNLSPRRPGEARGPARRAVPSWVPPTTVLIGTALIGVCMMTMIAGVGAWGLGQQYVEPPLSVLLAVVGSFGVSVAATVRAIMRPQAGRGIGLLGVVGVVAVIVLAVRFPGPRLCISPLAMVLFSLLLTASYSAALFRVRHRDLRPFVAGPHALRNAWLWPWLFTGFCAVASFIDPTGRTFSD